MPNVVQTAIDCQKFGGEGITVHPRPDERHIRRQDVFDLKPVVITEFNIEGYPTSDFIKLVTTIKPDQVTLVPDSPDALTSHQGWDTVKNLLFLTEVVKEFKAHGIRVSIFTGTELNIIEAAAKTGTDRVELYTEPYAAMFKTNKEAAIAPFVLAAKKAQEMKLGLNAGHDLNLENLNYFYKNIPSLLEVSIGHALIADALYLGLEKTIGLYLGCLK